MKKWIARLSILFIGIILGAVIGISSILYYGFNQPANLLGMYAVKYIVWELEELKRAFVNGNMETAIYALEHNIEILNFFSQVEGVNEWGAPTDLALNHIRLGLRLEEKGEIEKANSHFEKGFFIYNQVTTKKRNLDELKQFVTQIDEKFAKEEYNEIGDFKNIFAK